MKKNKYAFKMLTTVVCLLLLILSTTGCSIGRPASTNTGIQDYTDDGFTSAETASIYYDSTSAKFVENLISGTYYVVHNGLYYPVAVGESNYDTTQEIKNYVSPTRQLYFTTETEVAIPTLFLENGDTLVYYSTDTLLDYLTWERYYDFGYTVGIHDIKTMESERQYLDLKDDKVDCILSDSELYTIYSLGVESVLLDKVGGAQITKDLVSTGLLLTNKKSEQYDLEVYAGSYYQHYLTTANIHAFRAYELFKSIEYEALQDYFYEIKIPEYFVDGYYNVNSVGLFRFVCGNSYNPDPQLQTFNTRLLFNTDRDDEIIDSNPDLKTYEAPVVYSAFEPLNKFSTSAEGTLGYINPVVVSEDTTPEKESSDIVLKEATTKSFDLYFPADKQCSIKITSPAKETTGDISILVNDRETPLICDRISGIYTVTIKGTGTKGTLKISGLWNSYDVELVNCEQYTNQEEVAALEAEQAVVEEDTTSEIAEPNIVDRVKAFFKK